MSDTTRSIFVAQPDMTPEAWAAELAGTRIAAEADVRDLYSLVYFTRHPKDKRYLSHAFMLALCFTEHQYAADKASIEHQYRTNSWGMRRSLADKEIDDTAILATPRGQFVKYPNWGASLDDCCFALEDAGFVYQQEHRETIRTVIERWSPNGDFDNNAERRMATIATMMDRLALSAPPSGATGGTVDIPVNRDHPSPNRGYHNGFTHEPQAIVWHITEGTNSLGWLTDPASNASSNYLIARDGTIYELVPPTESAWANGAVCNPDSTNPLIVAWARTPGLNFNQRTISIEHEGKTSKGKGGSLTAAQVKATVGLTAMLCGEFGIAPDQTHILGHYEIDSCTRPNCPGFSGVEWKNWIILVAEVVKRVIPASKLMSPIVTPQQEWGPGSKGRIIALELTCVNDTDPQHPVYYSSKKEWQADGSITQTPFKEV